MKLDLSALQPLIDKFRDGRTEPPREVVQALASLIGDAEVLFSVAASARASETEEMRTKWECMALAGDSLVSVSGSRAGDWYMDDFYEDPVTPIIFGSLIPLREVAACRLLSVKSSVVTEWSARWQLEFQSRDALMIPWPSHRTGQERHEALALEVAKRLR